MAGDMQAYNDIHRLFLQSIMSRAILPIDKALQDLKKIVQSLGYNTPLAESDLTDIVTETNAKISQFCMEIKMIKSEVDGQDFVVFVNNVDDSLVLDKIDHPYSVKERDVFRLLLEAIVTNDTHYGVLPMVDALNLPNHSMGPGGIQDLVDKLIKDKWFGETPGGDIFLAPRCIAEFDSYFQKNFDGHVQICMLCSNVVFLGCLCQCGVITHRHCIKAFYQGRSAAEIKCPSCKNVIQPVENATNGVESQKESGSRRRKRNNHEIEETPDNTPGPSRRNYDEAGPSSAPDDTPGPSRPRRKRPSPQ